MLPSERCLILLCVNKPATLHAKGYKEHYYYTLFYCCYSSQILSCTSGPPAAPQKGKEGADSETLEVQNVTEESGVGRCMHLWYLHTGDPIQRCCVVSGGAVEILVKTC